MKRIILTLVTLIVMATMLALAVSAETVTGSCGENVTYSFSPETGVLTISGEGDMDDYPYFEIDVDSVIKVIIENGVKSVGSDAFWGFNSLTDVVIAGSVTRIGDYAFGNCVGLTEIEIPNSVASIGEYVFDGCKNLLNIKVDVNNAYFCDVDGVLFNKDKTTLIRYPQGRVTVSYSIPDSVISIGEYAFEAAMLESITIPNGVCEINGSAFRDCIIEECSIEIPSSVSYINGAAFSGTTLNSIDVADDNAYYTDIDGVLYNKDITELVSFPKGKDADLYDIPTTVTKIGNCGFYGNMYLKSLVIPDNVTIIRNAAFSECSSLESIQIPSSVSVIYFGLFRDCVSLKSIIIPGSVTTIERSAFSGCTSLETITIPDSAITIGDRAFEGCTALKSIKLSNNITAIDDRTFYGCTSLESIVIPDGVTSIGSYAFAYCENLCSATIPTSVTSITSRAFEDCHEDLVINCYKESYADTYAVKNGIAVKYLDEAADSPAADVDGDGEVTLSDALVTINAVLKGEPIDGGDINGDGIVSLIDILRIMKALAA